MATGAKRRRRNAAQRVQIGPFWLWYRAERDDWHICWWEPGSGPDEEGRTRRQSTGIGGGGPGDPPIEAEEALAAHFAANSRPSGAQEPAEAGVSELMGLWLADKKTIRLARHGRYGYSVKAWERFFDAERAEGLLGDRIVLADLNKATVERFIEHRLGAGLSGETVQGDISAMRRCLSYALEEEMITAAPKIAGVDPKDRPGSREIEFDMEQVAAILEAAARLPDRRHVLLFAMIMLSTHARCEAVLELYSHQIEAVPIIGGDVRRIFNFNSAGRRQTTKRRSRVPVCSVLVPWLRDIEGKVITYRAPIAERKWADPQVPEYFERPCADIGNAFEHCLVEAGLAHPTLGLIEPVLKDGVLVVKLNKRTGEAVPQWRGIGTPNTLRHTCHTYHQTVGTPQAQIDMAAGHSAEQGSGRNYTHLRPEYLKDFMAATEAYWEAMGKLTQVHLRDRAAGVVVPLRRG